ncbi:proteasome endopeptidase complex beta subunit [Salana multivorans]|uniref:Proteasome subunit beta n=1 Tax=Salana multivorans TaxID=120377 RepID=A0A3N2D0W4_9MICO|nr:proteasome subunit beta [Salana multivorans]ROR93420.1 proteasome endopeptidase complex beta subunit [Salana multivorans]
MNDAHLTEAYLRLGGTSFLDFASEVAPEVLPSSSQAPAGVTSHATTIVALTCPGAVVMAGDRRATSGTRIAHREIEKVFPADTTSAIGIAGAAGVGLELVRLFQLELEHYEKIEGVQLSLEGKANRLARLVRGNLSLAFQGLVALPLLGGHDAPTGTARLYSYDAVGGRYAERDHHAIGSGAVFAGGTLKNHWRADLTQDEAVALALAAILDAADDDAATGGVDLVRGIYPVVAVVDARGFRRVPDAELRGHVERIVATRAEAQR